MENFMKSMKIFGLALVGTMSLVMSGCGNGNSNPPPAAQGPGYPGYNPNQPWNQQQMSQPFVCQAGVIQLRNAFGSPQCFNTTVLAQACAQVGGMVSTDGATCRKERRLQGAVSGRLRRVSIFRRSNDNSSYSSYVNIPVQLFSGESLKLVGNVDAAEWSAQLLQNGMAVGSASSGWTTSGDSFNNFAITATPMVQQQQVPQGQVQPNQFPNQFPNQQFPNQQFPNQQFPNQQFPNQQFPGGYMNMNQGMVQNYVLEFMVSGQAQYSLNRSAVSCEDGRGNSYPCL